MVLGQAASSPNLKAALRLLVAKRRLRCAVRDPGGQRSQCRFCGGARASSYQWLGDDFGPREGVHCVRDMGADTWERSLSVGLAPSHDCRLSDLVHSVVERLEQRTGAPLQWAAWVHRDTEHAHAHLILRADGLSEGDVKHLERAIEQTAHDGYAQIREQQREFMREREQRREQGLQIEP
jgi:hypothetical protein